jgi:SOS-response transcriptional repressor LexA
MSSKDNQVLKFIIRYKSENNGNSPSYEDIMAACGISTKSHVKAILDKLEVSGALERDGTRHIVVPNSEWIHKEA